MDVHEEAQRFGAPDWDVLGVGGLKVVREVCSDQGLRMRATPALHSVIVDSGQGPAHMQPAEGCCTQRIRLDLQAVQPRL